MKRPARACAVVAVAAGGRLLCKTFEKGKYATRHTPACSSVA